MPNQGPLTATITALLGAALGGLMIWQVYRTKKRRLSSIQKVADSLEGLCPVTKDSEFTTVVDQSLQPTNILEEFQTVQCQHKQLAPPTQIPPSDQLLVVNPVLVSSEEEWQGLWPKMEKELSVIPVLGIDCEWVSSKDKASVVSLLQMASYSGLCILVRLLPFRNRQPFPQSLLNVLGDQHVLKVGVGCYEDGQRLKRDYGLSLASTVDVRHLAVRQRQASLSNGLSLKSLAADLLRVPLDKSVEVCCSDWEADELTQEQMTYAARDAQISVALFLHLLGLQPEAGPAFSSGSSYLELASRCQGLVDVPFRGQGDGGHGADVRKKKQTTIKNPECGDQQVSGTPWNRKKKAAGASYSARKSPLYDNCFLLAPDGQRLCTCDKKKANWYLSKKLGVLECEDPFSVRLLFEPSGRPNSKHDYYVTAKKNCCVVCGTGDSCVRKKIVPNEYRQHFPTEIKDHNSHDILLVCVSCHVASSHYDAILKQQLAEEFDAPQGCEAGLGMLEDSGRWQVRSAARALLSAGEGLPERRRQELQATVKSFVNKNIEEELTDEELHTAANLETRIFNTAFVPHGLKVVQAHAAQGLQGLMLLERRWREHFLNTMKPRYLPLFWNINHNHEKFIGKNK
ncbi:exonuclease 3'-5' domain-containing protein 2 isoform 2-T2 [Pholidichthys leucotaenia]